MNEPTNIQEILFGEIRSKLPQHLSLVHELSELLSISYDSAYRRIRGEKELSLEELKAVCHRFEISADTLFNYDSRNVVFRSIAIGSDGYDLSAWLRNLLDAIRIIHAAHEREIIYAAKDIPVFYYFEFPDIAAFKIYFWNKALIPVGDYTDRLLENLEPPAELYETGKHLLMHYVKIPTVEIWSEETISSILRQIEYCYISGFFRNTADVLKLCDTLHDWLNHVKSQAELGFQYMVGRPPEGIENSFRLYRNEVLVTDNTILVNTDGQRTTYNTYNVINQLITTHPGYCRQVENSLRNLMQKSTMISGTSAKERNRFFIILHEKINALRDRIGHLQ